MKRLLVPPFVLAQPWRLPWSLLVHWPCNPLWLFCRVRGDVARRWQLFPGAKAWSNFFFVLVKVLVATNLPQTQTQEWSQWVGWLRLSWFGRKKNTSVVSRAGSHPLLSGAGERALARFSLQIQEQLCYLAAMVTRSALGRSCIKHFLQIHLQNCEKLPETMVILARAWAILAKKWHKAVSQIWRSLVFGTS